MKKTALLLAVAIILMPLAGFADEALYKSKCLSCHGADGKKNAKKDLTSAAVQGKTDEALVTFLTTNGVHKAKVTSPDQAKSLVTYVRSLKK